MTRTLFALSAVAAVAASASAQETGLLGLRLFDKAAKVIAIYGTPDQIVAASAGTMTPGGAPGGRGGAGGGAPGGAPGGGGGGAPGGISAVERFSPSDLGDEILRQIGRPGGGPPSGVGGPPAGFPGGPGGRPGGFPGAPGGAPGAPAGGGGAATSVSLVRWIYNRNGSKYGFVINKLGQVVQIEALGLENRKVRTRKGVGFGSTFGTLIRAYGNPDGYEINGDNLLVKYLSRQKIAFRLSRLGPKKPQVVIGVVVSAGKA